MIYVLTGNGKGKTTSAIGMGLRAVGAGKKVFMIQFLKTGSSENEAIKKIKNFNIEPFGREGLFLPRAELEENPQLKKKGVKPLIKKDFELAEKGFDLVKKIVKSKDCDFLILDEVFIVLKFNLLDKKTVLDFLKKNRKKLDIVLTGRYCPSQILKIADLITDFKEKRHYYKKGIKSRKGIEY